MAYTQNPGRSPLLKTGNGIPSALLQKNKNTGQSISRFDKINLSEQAKGKINEIGEKNKLRLATEGQARIDSTSAANSRLGTDFEKALAGSAAANKTRTKAGFGDMGVSHSKVSSGAGWPLANTENFYRNNKVELEFPKLSLNPSTGQYNSNPKDTGRTSPKGGGNYVSRNGK